MLSIAQTIYHRMVGWLANDELHKIVEGCGRNLTYSTLPPFSWKDWGKPMIHLSQDSRCLGWDSNLEPPELVPILSLMNKILSHTLLLLTSILILSSYPRLRFRGLVPSGFLSKFVYVFLISFMHATYTAHLILLDLIFLIKQQQLKIKIKPDFKPTVITWKISIFIQE
jgi:hypothetical protein